MVSFSRAKGAWGRIAAAGLGCWLILATQVLASTPNGSKPTIGDGAQTNQPERPAAKAPTLAQPPPSISKGDNKADTKDNHASEKPQEKPRDEPIKLTDAIMAVAAVASAFFAFVLAVFPYRLIVVGRDQHRAAMKALDLARDEFTASHPPQITIRRISLHEGTMPLTAPITTPWKVQYIIANTGRGSATIIEGNATISELEAGSALPAIPPFEDADDFSGGWKLAAGESRPLQVDLEKSRIDMFRGQIMMESGGYSQIKDLFFFGYIQYKDDIGIVRRTAFCRQFNARTKRFAAVGDGDYEYS